MGMKFTEEMLAEDEKCWGNRDVLTELKYCGNYMRDRNIMTNRDIRFYAYIMRKAHDMLKEQETVKIEVKKINNSGRCGRCPNCLIELNEMDYPNYCGYCGQKVKWK